MKAAGFIIDSLALVSKLAPYPYGEIASGIFQLTGGIFAIYDGSESTEQIMNRGFSHLDKSLAKLTDNIQKIVHRQEIILQIMSKMTQKLDVILQGQEVIMNQLN